METIREDIIPFIGTGIYSNNFRVKLVLVEAGCFIISILEYPYHWICCSCSLDEIKVLQWYLSEIDVRFRVWVH
jgi:hypothetical protein